MPEQQTLPLPGASPPKFVIPDEPTPAPETAASEPSEPVQNTGEQATPATSEAKPEEKKEEVTPEVAAKREGRRFERRLDKAYRKAAEAQARAEFAEKRAAELEKAQRPSAPVEGEPTLAQFDYDPEKYAQAKAEFAKTQVQKELEAKQRTEAQKAAHQKLLSSWEEKAERGADKYDDWTEKVGVLQPNVPAFAALMEADNAEDIAYHLGKNPKEAMRILQLPPLAQVREIGKLEAKLLSEPEKPKTPSKAPAPITPLTGVAQVATDVPSEQDDMATWIKKRQKQVYGKRKS